MRAGREVSPGTRGHLQAQIKAAHHFPVDGGHGKEFHREPAGNLRAHDGGGAEVVGAHLDAQPEDLPVATSREVFTDKPKGLSSSRGAVNFKSVPTKPTWVAAPARTRAARLDANSCPQWSAFHLDSMSRKSAASPLGNILQTIWVSVNGLAYYLLSTTRRPGASPPSSEEGSLYRYSPPESRGAAAPGGVWRRALSL